jgi:hypothetical protein
MVERLREYDAGAVAEAGDKDPDWGSMERRLAEECRAKAAERSKGPGRSGWGLWVPALGYGLAAVLIYPAWLGVAGRREKPESPAAAARIVDLTAVRGEAGLVVVEERAGERAVVLQFFVPVRAGERYTAEIRNSAGQVVARLGEVKSYDGNGNFAVVVEPRGLKAGRYVVVVQGGASAVFGFERR